GMVIATRSPTRRHWLLVSRQPVISVFWPLVMPVATRMVTGVSLPSFLTITCIVLNGPWVVMALLGTWITSFLVCTTMSAFALMPTFTGSFAGSNRTCTL